MYASRFDRNRKVKRAYIIVFELEAVEHWELGAWSLGLGVRQRDGPVGTAWRAPGSKEC